MPKLSMGKTRPVEDPYLTIVVGRPIDILAGVAWTFKVLKAYTKDPDAQYARWFVSVKTPYTGGGSDMGDTYISDILAGGPATIVFRDPVVQDADLPAALRPA